MSSKPNKNATIVGLLLLLLFLVTRKSTPGPAVPSGTVGTVTVGQRARMGAHLVPKTPGSLVSVSVVWTPNTRTGAGQPINWPYLFDYDLIERATGIVRQGGGLGQVAATTGPITSSFSHLLTGLPPGAYDYKVSLWAPNSKLDGTPGDQLVLLHSVTHLSAIQVA